jgi:hypothetical protein
MGVLYKRTFSAKKLRIAKVIKKQEFITSKKPETEENMLGRKLEQGKENLN